VKILKTILVFSILFNILISWIFYLQYKKDLKIESIGDSRVSRYEHLVSASGTLFPLNYDNNSIYVVDIDCNLRTKICHFASMSGSHEGYYFLRQETQEISSFDGTRIIIENNDPYCRREIWKIDLISNSIFLDSHPKDLKEQRGDCSYLESKTLRSKFVDFYERRKQLGKY
jgi:hypothetical protein